MGAFAWSWLTLAALCTVYVAVDQFRGNPEATVMKWGWVLITRYMGPVGLLLYVLTDKEPAPGTHEEFVKPLWKQGVGSTVHCIAGDATGIIHAAVVTATLGLPMWIDLIVEYVARLRLRPVHLPGPVHEGHDGRHLPAGAAPLVRLLARIVGHRQPPPTDADGKVKSRRPRVADLERDRTLWIMGRHPPRTRATQEQLESTLDRS
jgi:hypothetical protein